MAGLSLDRCADVATLVDRGEHLEEAHGVAQALVGVVLRDRAPLALVGVEQVGRGPPVLDGGKLPRQVVRVSRTGVETEPAGGREAMSGITDEEAPTFAIARGDLTRHGPRRDSDHVDVAGRDVGPGGAGEDARRTARP